VLLLFCFHVSGQGRGATTTFDSAVAVPSLSKIQMIICVTGKFCLKQVTAIQQVRPGTVVIIQQARPETSNCCTEAKPKNKHFWTKVRHENVQ